MVDPRKFDCVWLERADYESMMHRPMKTAAEPTPAATTAAPSAVKESKPLSYAQVGLKQAYHFKIFPHNLYLTRYCNEPNIRS